MRIAADEVSVSLGGAQVLDRVSLAFEPGELVGLIGPNGAGKTTLLRVLAGLHQPDRGALHVDGRLSTDLIRREFARRIAYLAQNGRVEWSLRVDHLVALGRLPHRRLFAADSPGDERAVEAALHATRTARLRGRIFHTLSGGERMRVLLARALAVEAEMLLADEPTAALDPLHQLQAMDLLRSVASRGAGVIVVLHDLTLATRYCDRIVLLDRGRIVLDGAPTTLGDDLISEIYGVEVVRGHHDGAPYLVTWRALQADDKEEERGDEERG
ncbi:MAG: ABC transporter ATP-binding protein [Hyphomicrobiales bacterium]|nr:ABC transporter ATP-binding protein [Hyphomicrobiales bacterium]